MSLRERNLDDAGLKRHLRAWVAGDPSRFASPQRTPAERVEADETAPEPSLAAAPLPRPAAAPLASGNFKKIAKVSAAALVLVAAAVGGDSLNVWEKLSSFLAELRVAVEFDHGSRLMVAGNQIVCGGKAYGWIVRQIELEVLNADGTLFARKVIPVSDRATNRGVREFDDGIELPLDGRTRTVTVTVRTHEEAARALEGANYAWMQPRTFLAECTPRGILVFDPQTARKPEIAGIVRDEGDLRNVLVTVRTGGGVSAAAGVAYWSEKAPEIVFAETAAVGPAEETVVIRIVNVPQGEPFRFQPYLLIAGDRETLAEQIAERSQAENLHSGDSRLESDFERPGN